MSYPNHINYVCSPEYSRPLLHLYRIITQATNDNNVNGTSTVIIDNIDAGKLSKKLVLTYNRLITPNKVGKITGHIANPNVLYQKSLLFRIYIRAFFTFHFSYFKKAK